MDYDEYNAKLASIGDALLAWADPEQRFSGYTKVRTNPVI
jgi:hypothetical protein